MIIQMKQNKDGVWYQTKTRRSWVYGWDKSSGPDGVVIEIDGEILHGDALDSFIRDMVDKLNKKR